MHYLALVVHEVLYGERGGDYLMARSIMVELSARQRQYSYTKLRQVFVGHSGVGAEGTAEFGIHVVVLQRAVGVH